MKMNWKINGTNSDYYLEGIGCTCNKQDYFSNYIHFENYCSLWIILPINKSILVTKILEIPCMACFEIKK